MHIIVKKKILTNIIIIYSKLAKEAESNMEAVHPPIFLRFVNLLMNDGIFLLDEALGNMAQIRTMQTTMYVDDFYLLFSIT